MKKLLIIFVFGIFMTSFASAIITTEVFYDGFENADFATVWTSDAQFSRSTNNPQTGTYSIWYDSPGTDVTMEVTPAQNVSNQTSCNLTAGILIESGLDGGEYACLDYSFDDGVTWNRNTGSDGGVGGLCQDGNVDTEGVFRTVYYEMGNPSGNETFKFRVRVSSGTPNEDAYIDNVNLTCNYNIPPVMANVTGSHSTIKGGTRLRFMRIQLLTGLMIRRLIH